MNSQLRKTIVIPFTTYEKSEEVIINVNWDILEKVERVFGTSADYVATMILTNIFHVQRHQIAKVLGLWCQGKNEKLKQVDIAEAVQTCNQKQFIIYIGMIQAAILWSIRGPDGQPLINDLQFDKLIAGEDLEEPPKSDESKTTEDKAGDKPKKPRSGTSKKRTD